jgi:hypothetical protein
MPSSQFVFKNFAVMSANRSGSSGLVSNIVD